MGTPGLVALILVALAVLLAGAVLVTRTRRRAAAPAGPRTVAELVQLRAERAEVAGDGPPPEIRARLADSVPRRAGTGWSSDAPETTPEYHDLAAHRTAPRPARPTADPAPAATPVATAPKTTAIALPAATPPSAPGPVVAAAETPEPVTTAVPAPAEPVDEALAAEAAPPDAAVASADDNTPWGRAALMAAAGSGAPIAYVPRLVPPPATGSTPPPETPPVWTEPGEPSEESWSGWADWNEVDAEVDAEVAERRTAGGRGAGVVRLRPGGRAAAEQPGRGRAPHLTAVPGIGGRRRAPDQDAVPDQRTSATDSAQKGPAGTASTSETAAPAGTKPELRAVPGADTDPHPARSDAWPYAPVDADPGGPDERPGTTPAAGPGTAGRTDPPKDTVSPTTEAAAPTEPVPVPVAARPALPVDPDPEAPRAPRRPLRSPTEQAAEQAAADLALLRTFGYADPGLRPDSAPVVSLASNQDPRPEPVETGPAQPVRFAVTGHGGAPVGGAVLTLLDDRGREVATGTAAADGRGEFEAPHPGAYMVVSSAPGHRAVAVAVGVAEEPAEVEVVLTPSASVHGAVSGEDGPITGARVTLVQDSEIVDAVDSDRDGGFRLDDVPPGEYGLSVAAAGHEPFADLLIVPDATVVCRDVDLEPALPQVEPDERADTAASGYQDVAEMLRGGGRADPPRR